jgi:hypothetical protein
MNPFAAIVQQHFPDRETCQRCLMTFHRNKATQGAEGPIRCPECGRRFWAGLSLGGGKGKVVCYTAGHWPGESVA